MTTIHNNILPSVHAEGENINESFDQIVREIDAEFQLKQARADLEKTRAALQAQTAATQRLHNERQIERELLARPGLTPKAVESATKLILSGEAGELEVGPRGLREKFGTRDLGEVITDFLRQNPNFTKGDNNAESATSGAPTQYKNEMNPRMIADFVTAHGRAAFHALPRERTTLKK